MSSKYWKRLVESKIGKLNIVKKYVQYLRRKMQHKSGYTHRFIEVEGKKDYSTVSCKVDIP